MACFCIQHGMGANRWNNFVYYKESSDNVAEESVRA